MASINNPSQGRVSTLLSVGGNPPSSRNNDDSPRHSRIGLRPLPASREPSPAAHHRLPSIELHLSRSNQNLPTASRDTSPGWHSRNLSSEFHPYAPLQNLYASQSPSLDQQHPSSIGQPQFSTPAYGLASPNAWQNMQSPASVASPTPLNAMQLGPNEEDILLPPRPIGDGLSERGSSPPSSRRGSIPRGRLDYRSGSLPHSRASSPAYGSDGSRPVTPSEGKIVKKRGWLSDKSHNRSESGSSMTTSSQAWVVTPQGRSSYDVSQLLKAQPVLELWDANGNIFVHLFHQDLGLGPSFRLDSAIIESSRTLSSLVYGPQLTDRGRHAGSQDDHYTPHNIHKHMRQVSLDVPSLMPRPKPVSTLRSSSIDGQRHGSLEGARLDGDAAGEPPMDAHLYLSLGIDPDTPITALSPDDIDRAVSVRNLFAFLVGQILVGTPKHPSLFPIFQNIASLLQRYEFTNLDGTTFGEVPSIKFMDYADDLRLDDVRTSREKTIEAIVLGERMKSWKLYNEGFVHGVGKWDDILNLNPPVLSQISGITRSRMEKASMDLYIRLKSMRSRLEDFEFPSLFTAISTENKNADFKAWKASFTAIRKHVLAIYKNQYGSWPPKAKSKKNDFEESGLNRLLLKEVYQDFSDLYDMLVDRTSFTTRTADMHSHDEILSTDSRTNALRKLMGEFDCSSPPVQPPMPFDIPLFPSLTATRRDFASLPPKKQAKESSKKLKDDEINMALMQSYNRDSVKVTPFLEAFIAFERQAAHAKSMEEMTELRIGQWIFIYVVLQSLPLVVTDAPGLKWTHGVEYFLCEVPKGSPPWIRDDTGRQKKGYYRAAGGSIVSLPPDMVDHGVEGIYRRSHCWQAAERWTTHDAFIAGYPPPRTSSRDPNANRKPLPQDFFEGTYSGLAAPSPLYTGSIPGSRSSSPDRQSPRGSVAFGLEAVPLPHGVVPEGLQPGLRSVSTPDPTKSFENILGEAAGAGKKRK